MRSTSLDGVSEWVYGLSPVSGAAHFLQSCSRPPKNVRQIVRAPTKRAQSRRRDVIVSTVGMAAPFLRRVRPIWACVGQTHKPAWILIKCDTFTNITQKPTKRHHTCVRWNGLVVVVVVRWNGVVVFFNIVMFVQRDTKGESEQSHAQRTRRQNTERKFEWTKRGSGVGRECKKIYASDRNEFLLWMWLLRVAAISITFFLR